MAVDAVGSTSTADQSQTLGQNEFLKLMLQQLRYQDPTQPLKHTEFVAQMAQFSNLAQVERVNEGMSQVLRFQATNQSIGLLSKYAEFQFGSGTLTGQIVNVKFDDSPEGPKMTLRNGSQDIPNITLSQILRVSTTAL